MLILNTISNSKICGDVILLQDIIFSLGINIRANLLETELYTCTNFCQNIIYFGTTVGV